MKPLCGLCEITLQTACELYGKDYCDLRDRYYTDPDLKGDQVVQELMRTLQPDQVQELKENVLKKLHPEVEAEHGKPHP